MQYLHDRKTLSPRRSFVTGTPGLDFHGRRTQVLLAGTHVLVLHESFAAIYAYRTTHMIAARKMKELEGHGYRL